MNIKICKQCKGVFFVSPSHNRQKFCSSKCYGGYRHEHLDEFCVWKVGHITSKISREKMRVAKLNHIPWWTARGMSNPTTLPEIRKINSEKHKGKEPWNKGLTYETDERVKRCVEKSLPQLIRNLHLKPNQLEQMVIKLLKENDLPYKYCGDFSVMIGRKSPDFINHNGQKKLIEIFGDYWHDDADVQNRRDFFAKFGFDTLIIWEHELKDKSQVIEKIKQFDGGVV